MPKGQKIIKKRSKSSTTTTSNNTASKIPKKKKTHKKKSKSSTTTSNNNTASKIPKKKNTSKKKSKSTTTTTTTTTSNNNDDADKDKPKRIYRGRQKIKKRYIEHKMKRDTCRAKRIPTLLRNAEWLHELTHVGVLLLITRRTPRGDLILDEYVSKDWKDFYQSKTVKGQIAMKLYNDINTDSDEDEEYEEDDEEDEEEEEGNLVNKGGPNSKEDYSKTNLQEKSVMETNGKEEEEEEEDDDDDYEEEEEIGSPPLSPISQLTTLH